MSIMNYFRSRPKTSADQAKERLQILLAHERAGSTRPDYLPRMQAELMQVIARYIEIDEDMISVEFENSGTVSTIEVNIELPTELVMQGSSALAVAS
ncbi:MAG: cell division topological specificity factor MinE [Rhodospirillales bacterium]|nr:cell division topological specificity factor MinE [Rhodospirillales bacterium]